MLRVLSRGPWFADVRNLPEHRQKSGPPSTSIEATAQILYVCEEISSVAVRFVIMLKIVLVRTQKRCHSGLWTDRSRTLLGLKILPAIQLSEYREGTTKRNTNWKIFFSKTGFTKMVTCTSLTSLGTSRATLKTELALLSLSHNQTMHRWSHSCVKLESL